MSVHVGQPSTSAESEAPHRRPGMVGLAVGTLGIVYGDIGTSPLYAFRESFEHSDLAVTQANAYGVASVVFWALVIIISIKYLLLVMRAAGVVVERPAQPRPPRADPRALGRHRRHPRVDESVRCRVVPVRDGVYQVVLTFGFMEEPDVVSELGRIEIDGRPIDPDHASFFIGRETVTSTPVRTMPAWREQLFVLLNRGAASASRFYNLPSKQVLEVGTQVEI